MSRIPRASLIMFLYADVLILAGIVAFFLAPEEANPATALIVPGGAAVLMILCAALAWQIKRSRTLGMIGIHAGLVLPLLFAVAFLGRAIPLGAAVTEHREQRAAYEQAVEQGLHAPDDFAGYLGTVNAGRGADYDRSYLMYTLWFLAGVSVVAFVALLAGRPKPEERGAAETDRTPGSPEP